MTSRRSFRLNIFPALPLLGFFPWPEAHTGAQDRPSPETTAGWAKSPKSPVLGGDLGSGTYRMWFSWRPRKSIALVESKDGIAWSSPVVVLGPNDENVWEGDLYRPVVIRHDGLYRSWYTGQAGGKSWRREGDKPALSAEKPWEKVALMCPHVFFDDQAGLYRMWYSGGEQHGPDAIGHATSKDGLAWVKDEGDPVFRPDPALEWEKDRVTACKVIRRGDGYVMFSIGLRDRDHAQIGLARSGDGITGW